MYRRRNQKQVQQEQKVEEKKVEKKEEPVIKYVVQPRGAAMPEIGKVPMLNTLRSIDYFNITSTAQKPVSMKYVVNTLLSHGYLNADFAYYNDDNESTPKKFTSDDGDWSALYQDTTNFNRKTFAPGDLIMFKTNTASAGNLTVGLLIDKIYTTKASETGLEEESKLKYDPPVPLENVRTSDPFEVEVSGLQDCKGISYMFNEGTKLRDIAKFCSYTADQTEGSEKYSEIRKLEPTNMSEFAGVDSRYVTTNSWGKTARKTGDDNYIPPYTDATDIGSRPYPAASGSDSQFNLTSGVIVDGWLIYLTGNYTDAGTSTTIDNEATAFALAGVQTIMGDVVKTEKVAITTIGNQILNVGNIFQIPYSVTKQVVYSGNSTKFASEPLNSEQYQLKYGDTVGERYFTITEQKIYSLKKCCLDGSKVPVEGTI